MSGILSNKRLADELIKRGLVPEDCRLMEIRVEPSGPMVICYEVFVRADKLVLLADAMKSVADDVLASDERNRQALTKAE